ncbi:MAG: hypothetical protein WCI34_05625, partial [Actinomycetes bacterium]
LSFTLLPKMAQQALPLGLIAAVWQAQQKRRAPLLIACLAAFSVAVVMVEVDGGANGVPRYTFGAQAYLIALAGFGLAVLVGLVAKGLSTVGVPMRVAIAIPVLLALFSAWTFTRNSIYPRVRAIRASQATFARNDDSLKQAINAAGGIKRVIGCGPVARFPANDPTIAWKLGETSGVLSFSGGPDDPFYHFKSRYGTTFRLPLHNGGTPWDNHIRPRIAPHARRIPNTGRWIVYQRCLRGNGWNRK